MDLNDFMQGLERRNPGQPEFYQAVQEVAQDLHPFIEQNPRYDKAMILERLTEPDRVIMFRVCWEDDQGNVRVDRGFRVQFNNTIGPYKGGLRFDKSVNLGVLKFLGFEQIFKNSLTTLPLGGAKGGANFNPKGKSDAEVMRFCQSFMTELFRHIGADMDIPAGDIGVGKREIAYLFGQYKRISKKFVSGVLTGKGLEFGGSAIRPEATGYGAVYFAREMLKQKGQNFEGKKCLVSGSGNVAQYATEKLIELGAKVICLSDRSGFFHDPEGLNSEKLAYIKELKNKKRGSLKEFAEAYELDFYEDEKPWGLEAELAFPCATQNEIELEDAKALIKNGIQLLAEGANMPCLNEAVEALLDAKVLYAPGKAANAGGVAISGLEMTQNAMRLSWTREEVDQKLQDLMVKIHDKCQEYGQENNFINYRKGANIGGFVKVADAMIDYGII